MEGFSIPDEAAVDKVVVSTETKPLVEVLNSHKLYSSSKLPPAPRFGRKAVWRDSEDFVYPNDGKLTKSIIVLTYY